MTHLLLSHLSKENNSPQLVEKLFTPYANGTSIIVASRYEPTDVFTITATSINGQDPIANFTKPVQLGLFE